MKTSPLSTGSFIAALSAPERNMLTDVQEKLRTERSLERGPQGTIELPLQWCQEAVLMHRQGKVSAQGLRQALEWSLRNPEQVESIANVVETQVQRLVHERANPQEEDEIEKLSASHAQWRETHASRSKPNGKQQEPS